MCAEWYHDWERRVSLLWGIYVVCGKEKRCRVFISAPFFFQFMELVSGMGKHCNNLPQRLHRSNLTMVLRLGHTLMVGEWYWCSPYKLYHCFHPISIKRSVSLVWESQRKSLLNHFHRKCTHSPSIHHQDLDKNISRYFHPQNHRN